MKTNGIAATLLAICVTFVACGKHPDINMLQNGTYSVSGMAYFDNPILYTKGSTITDKKIVTDFLNNNQAQLSGYFELDSSSEYDPSIVGEGSIQILSDTTALLSGFDTSTSPVLYTIQHNNDGTLNLTSTDSFFYIGNNDGGYNQNGCSALLSSLLQAPKLYLSSMTGFGITQSAYKTLSTYRIDIEDGRIMLQKFSIYVTEKILGNFCSSEENSFVTFNPAGLERLTTEDTVVTQVYKIAFDKVN